MAFEVAVTQSSNYIGFTQRESSVDESECDDDDEEDDNCVSFPIEDQRFLPENRTQDEKEMYDATVKAEAAYTPCKSISAKNEKSSDSACSLPINTPTPNSKKRKNIQSKVEL